MIARLSKFRLRIYFYKMHGQALAYSHDVKYYPFLGRNVKPISRVFPCFTRRLLTRTISFKKIKRLKVCDKRHFPTNCGIPSVMHTTNGISASIAS